MVKMMGKRKKWRGEVIIQRRNDLDFSLPIYQVTNGLMAKLPDHPYHERIDHYNKKLKRVFRNIKKKAENECNTKSRRL